jgi:hypothetical protein
MNTKWEEKQRQIYTEQEAVLGFQGSWEVIKGETRKGFATKSS